MMHRLLRAMSALFVCAFCVGAAPAMAQYNCSVSGGGAVNFLVYNPAAGSPTTASVNVTLTCNYVSGGGSQVNWSMVLSNGSSGNCNARTMSGPGGPLNYNIYQGTVPGGVWGNLACATFPSGRFNVGPGAGNGTRSVTNTMLGQMPTGQYVTSGTYNDNLVLTVNF
jgi:spore coat protein U-like protein